MGAGGPGFYQWSPGAIGPAGAHPTTQTLGGLSDLKAVFNDMEGEAKAGYFVGVELEGSFPLEVPGFYVTLKIEGEYTHFASEQRSAGNDQELELKMHLD